MKTISAAELKEKAKQLRKTAVTMIYEAQSGHPGGSLSIADIVADLYFREMNVDPKNPRWEDRDRFVLLAMILMRSMVITWKRSWQPLTRSTQQKMEDRNLSMLTP